MVKLPPFCTTLFRARSGKECSLDQNRELAKRRKLAYRLQSGSDRKLAQRDQEMEPKALQKLGGDEL